jgi:hypothetical protein
MKFTAPQLAVLLMLTHNAAAALGNNDDFANRRSLPGQDTVEIAIRRPATLGYEPFDPLMRTHETMHSSVRHGSLWWEWTAPRDGWFTVSVRAGDGGRPETCVFEGTSLARLVPVQNGNDRGLTMLNSTLFAARAGQKYHIGSQIAEDRNAAESGADTSVAVLRLEPSAGPPPNDSMGRRSVLSGPLPLHVTGTNLAAATIEGHLLAGMELVGSCMDFPRSSVRCSGGNGAAPKTAALTCGPRAFAVFRSLPGGERLPAGAREKPATGTMRDLASKGTVSLERRERSMISQC